MDYYDRYLWIKISEWVTNGTNTQTSSFRVKYREAQWFSDAHIQQYYYWNLKKCRLQFIFTFCHLTWEWDLRVANCWLLCFFNLKTVRFCISFLFRGDVGTCISSLLPFWWFVFVLSPRLTFMLEGKTARHVLSMQTENNSDP